MSARVRITKRDIKEDKFTTNMLLAKDWLDKNWQIVAIAAAIVVVGIVAVIYFADIQETKKVEGNDQLNIAVTSLRLQNYEEAITQFQNVISSYGGTVAARAQFYLANAYYESRNYEEARVQFQKYIDDYHHDNIITASAIAGIAACMENQQQFGPAGDKYGEAIEYYPDGPLVPDYYLGAVRCYTNGGDREKAEQMLMELEEKYPNSNYYRTAARLYMKNIS